MKKLLILLIVVGFCLPSTLRAATCSPCVEGTSDKSNKSCLPVKAKRIIYDCAPGFILTYTPSGYLCWDEKYFPKAKCTMDMDIDPETKNKVISGAFDFPCQPFNQQKDPESGKCDVTASGPWSYYYYSQVFAYQVGEENHQIYNADDTDQLGYLIAYGDWKCRGVWTVDVLCSDVIPHCMYCNGTPFCTKCDYGYTLSAGKCIKDTATTCPEGMKKSSDGCCCVAG